MTPLAILSFIASHFEVIELLYKLIVEKAVPRSQVVETLEAIMTEASDAEMRRELP